jgi:NAD(P)H-nitrite reductase large subunit
MVIKPYFFELMNLPPKIEIDEVICQCFQVNESTIRKVIAEGDLTEIDSVTESCEAGGGCHSCHILIQLFIDQHQEKSTAMEDLVHDHAQKVKKKGILGRFFKRFKPTDSSA